SKQGHAIWIARQKASTTSDSLSHYADALCVPLVSDQTTLGALHVYLERGRARRESTLQSSYQRLVEASPGYDELVGESPPMRDLKSKIGRLARATGCVLI